MSGITFEAAHPESGKVHRWAPDGYHEWLWFRTEKGPTFWLHGGEGGVRLGPPSTGAHVLALRDLGPVDPVRRVQVGDVYGCPPGELAKVTSVTTLGPVDVEEKVFPDLGEGVLVHLTDEWKGFPARLASLEERLAALEKAGQPSGDAGEFRIASQPNVEFHAVSGGEGGENVMVSKREAVTPRPRPKWATWPVKPNIRKAGFQEIGERFCECYTALDSRPGSDPIRDPEKARDVVEAARKARLSLIGAIEYMYRQNRVERCNDLRALYMALNTLERSQGGE